MNYETTENLFNYMDSLETYSKMYANEIHEAEPDWEAIGRYGDNMQEARKGIFSILQRMPNG